LDLIAVPLSDIDLVDSEVVVRGKIPSNLPLTYDSGPDQYESEQQDNQETLNVRREQRGDRARTMRVDMCHERASIGAKAYEHETVD
jgi:hypothetical protein